MKRDYLIIFEINTSSKNKVLSIAQNFLKNSNNKTPINLVEITKFNKEKKDKLLSIALRGKNRV